MKTGSPSLTGTTTLMINVENSNDKPPHFSPETQRAEVTEDTAIGTVFAVLKAIDPDSTEPEALNFAMSEPITAIDRNGQRVSGNTTAFKDFFAVDRKTGQVSVVKSLDRDVAATVSITVLVTDSSAPSLQQARGTFSNKCPGGAVAPALVGSKQDYIFEFMYTNYFKTAISYYFFFRHISEIMVFLSRLKFNKLGVLISNLSSPK